MLKDNTTVQFSTTTPTPDYNLTRDLESKRRKVREARSAGLVVIGDEILKGKCQDINTAFATQKLWEKVRSGGGEGGKEETTTYAFLMRNVCWSAY